MKAEERINKLVSEARIAHLRSGKASSYIAATAHIQALCDAIELLMKQLEKCKEQRDAVIKDSWDGIYRSPVENEKYAQAQIDDNNKEIDNLEVSP